MSVISVEERSGGRTYSRTLDGRRGGRVFLVRTNSASDTPREVTIASGIPRIGDAYPGDPWCRCVNVDSPEPIGDTGKAWEVRASYETPQGAGSNEAENPLEQPSDVSFDFTQADQPIDTTIDGLPIANSAGDLPDPPLLRTTDDFRLIVSRNEAAFSINAAEFYKNTVNSDVFFGRAPLTMKCVGISAVLQRTGTITYYRVSYEFEGRRFGAASNLISGYTASGYSYTLLDETPGWYLRFRNQGLRERDANGDLVDILDHRTGDPVAAPVDLNLDGTRRASDLSPVFVSVRVYREVPFAPLGLE